MSFMLMLDLLSGIGSTTLVLVISRLMVVRMLREEVIFRFSPAYLVQSRLSIGRRF